VSRLLIVGIAWSEMWTVHLLRMLLEREHLMKLCGKSKILHTSLEDHNDVRFRKCKA